MVVTLVLTLLVSSLLIFSEVLGLVQTVRPNGIVDLIRIVVIDIVKLIEEKYPSATPP